MLIDIPQARRPRSGFPRSKVSNGVRGNNPKIVRLNEPLERIVEGKSFCFINAEIIPGKEEKIIDTPYSIIYGILRITNLSGENLYHERIELIAENEKYTPREIHPTLKKEPSYYEIYKIPRFYKNSNLAKSWNSFWWQR